MRGKLERLNEGKEEKLNEGNSRKVKVKVKGKVEKIERER